MAGLSCAGRSAYAGKKEEVAWEGNMSSVIDDYLVDPKISLLDKTRM
jgi:hypothetical protein